MMGGDIRYALLLWTSAALCGLALAYQLRSGRALDWFGLEVTRTKNAALYWTYISVAGVCMICLAVIGTVVG